MADLGLTDGEAEILAAGARHLFGEPEANEQPKPKTPVKKGALSGLDIPGRKTSRQHPDSKKGSRK